MARNLVVCSGFVFWLSNQSVILHATEGDDMFSAIRDLGIRAVEPKTAVVIDSIWRICTTPEQLDDDCEYHLDHDDCVLWLTPGLTPSRRSLVIAVALERAASETLASLPSVS